MGKELAEQSQELWSTDQRVSGNDYEWCFSGVSIGTGAVYQLCW